MNYYKHHVFFCTNHRDAGRQCCQDHSAVKKRAYLKARIRDLQMHGEGGVRINTAGCLDRCDLGPVVVVYPEGVWYSYVDEQDLEDILQQHLIGGQPVERLRI